MAAGIKIPVYPKSKVNVVADTTQTIGIQMWPHVKLAIIVPDSAPPVTSTFLPRLNLLGAG